MFSNRATSKQISGGAAHVKRAATAIRAVVKGHEAFMQTQADIEQYKADFDEAEAATLHAAAKILERLHDRRSKQAKAAAAEERAFEARKKAARIEAARIFDSWQLDVAGWLPLVIYNLGPACILRDVREGIVAIGWHQDCGAARDCFLNQVSWEVASGKGSVAYLMTARREKLAAMAARECQDLSDLVQQITTALVALQLTRANAKAVQK
ncbi:MAG: hypothetical protein Q8J72_05350 [Rhodocyclaceae bacterium]|nr:hypothetical protein [Rhodocyclaceae bacterium]